LAMGNDTQAIPEVTIGIDVGDKLSHVCVMDRAGAVSEESRLATTPAALDRRFRGCGPFRIAFEVGPHSLWMERLLKELNHDVIVANPRKLRLIYENDSKSDRVDAEYLARLARLDPKLLAPVKHRGAKAQRARATLNARAALVEARTKLVNTIRGQVKSTGERLPSCSAESFASRVAAHVPQALVGSIAPLIEVVADLTQKIRDYDKQLERIAATDFPHSALLRQVSGVGPITSLAYVATIEDPARFKNGRAVGAYLGLRPRKDQSGDSDPQKRITKAGDPALRSLLVQSGHYILGPFGPDTDLRRWGLKLAARGGKAAKKRAIVAVARKLAALLRRLWMTAEVYEPLRSTSSGRLKNEPDRPVRATAIMPLARGKSAEAAQQKAAPELDGPQRARAGKPAGGKSANGSVANGSSSTTGCSGEREVQPKSRKPQRSRNTQGDPCEPAASREGDPRVGRRRRPPSRP
jgi:transposase